MISWFVGENRGRQNQFLALPQQTDVGAVLVHDREPLDAILRRTGLVDKDDTRIEIALLARQTLVDAVGDHVGNAPPVLT